ncbi:MAG: flagellar assembly peptidoglycan hydrolase FlgJ [Mizugakiibacter sp.]|uniref:flagellar assembly peptidoglycan hydrolase FlgJ n=1 Tax=Mizugakiibacter sp. TaxID=1972610 RepID=UPI0031C6742D|nr:flagellar assembly peptidoglycan hydrolase FlgJ [Xanthomonadaceae bacterium]
MAVDARGLGTYTDFAGLDRLKAAAKRNDSGALAKTAQQFEALFTQMLLKSMREASPGDGLFDSEQTRAYQQMFDQQLAVSLSNSGHGLGIAAMLMRQLGGAAAPAPDGASALSGALRGVPSAAPAALDAAAADQLGVLMERTGGALGDFAARAQKFAGRWLPSGPKEFVQALAPYAQAASKQLGVSARALLAQAALETGWGKHMPQHADGSASFNLFGIKAGDGWDGSRVNVPTLEFEDGVAVRRQDSFRAYASPAEAFADYTRLLGRSPRYAAALGRGDDVAGFAQALQSAGYATDPAYAAKLRAIAHSAQMDEALAALKESAALPPTRG